MKQGKISISVIPDERRVKNNGRLPLKLRITYKGERRYYYTGYDASINEWDKINSSEAKGNLRKIKNAIAELENNAQKCCDEISPFSFKQFEDHFFDQKIKFESVKTAFNAYIENLRSNDQFGTASSYQTACNKLVGYKPNFKFEDVTVPFLQKFEKWMLEQNKSITTVGIYLRPLRAVMNFAKDEGIVAAQDYPFGKRKYTIPTGRNIKKALNIGQIKEIFDYPTIPNTAIDRAKKIWIFSYLCNGINIMDIAHLQWKDISKETICFEREKTKRSKRSSPIKIVAVRNEHINLIIQQYGSQQFSQRPEDFVFNIIEKIDNGETIRKKVQQFTQTTNKWMKKIGDELGFEITLTTYVARHSFATILVRSGAPLAFASQSLGHSNMITTQKYFAGFDLADQTKYTTALTNF